MNIAFECNQTRKCNINDSRNELTQKASIGFSVFISNTSTEYQ
jgi:hypothetical protein